MKKLSHLLWIPAGAAVGFLASFVFGDLVLLPVDLYYLIYFGLALGFFALYTRKTGLDLRKWITRRLALGLALGVLGGLVLMQGVLVRPATQGLTGGMLVWALAWRGVAYGLVDGLLLLAFPWIVVWRALDAEEKGWPQRAGTSAVAWMAILLVTTTYHLGYGEFRSSRIAQPNIGSTIGAVPTIVSVNPAASVLAHVFLHVTAVVHSPATDLFLPPHRDRRRGQVRHREAMALGFTFSEVGELLELRVAEERTAEDVRERGVVKITETNAKIRDLERVRAALQGVVSACDARGPPDECVLMHAIEAREDS